MNAEEILIQTAAIIRDVALSGPVPITRSTKAMDVRGWDSLSHTMILLRLEDHFGVILPASRTNRLNDVGELLDLISEQMPLSSSTPKAHDSI